MTTSSRWLIGLALCAASGAGMGAELRLTVSDDNLRGEVVGPLQQRVGHNSTLLDGGVLYRDNNDNSTFLSHLGVSVHGDVGARRAQVQASVGARVYVLDAEPATQGAALTLGGQVTALAPNMNRLSGNLWLYYGPDVAAFGDVGDLFEFGVTAEYQLLRQAYLVLGFRKIGVGREEGGEANVDEGLHGGVRLVF